MKYSKEQLKNAILNLAKLFNKESVFISYFNEDIVLPRILRLLVELLFLKQFQYRLATDSTYQEYSSDYSIILQAFTDINNGQFNFN